MPIATPQYSDIPANSTTAKTFGDLVIKFALTPPITIENNNSSTQEIRSQGDLEELLERNKAISDDKSKRELLHMLKVIEKRKTKTS